MTLIHESQLFPLSTAWLGALLAEAGLPFDDTVQLVPLGDGWWAVG